MADNKQSLSGILRRPLITEKSTVTRHLSGSITFEVHPDANKPQIRKAVEKLFDVKVVDVKTMNYIGKLKRVKGQAGTQRSWKKALVKLAEGQTIEVVEGL